MEKQSAEWNTNQVNYLGPIVFSRKNLFLILWCICGKKEVKKGLKSLQLEVGSGGGLQFQLNVEVNPRIWYFRYVTNFILRLLKCCVFARWRSEDSGLQLPWEDNKIIFMNEGKNRSCWIKDGTRPTLSPSPTFCKRKTQRDRDRG